MNQALNNILAKFRASAKTEREKGTYFEELIQTYFRNEAAYKDLYSHVWTYAEWAKEYGVDGKDVGIDLVAKTNGTEEYHAIQCKFYDEGYTVQKKDIDSFFTASGKKPFTHRIIVTTTDKWSNNAEDALRDQTPPVTKIDLFTLAKSQIDWSKYDPKKAVVLKPKKELRPHQEKALKDVESGLASAERGKLIMACGTGKTFTALKVAEKLAGKGKRVLFLVPSLSLLSQTLTEWTQESKTPLHSFAVCSDSDIGKKRGQDEIVAAHELEYPATTDAKSLAREVDKLHDKNHMSVVFSTYHSIDVIGAAQKKHDLAEFDLIICDEAHRTTGATFADEQDDESSFVKIHDNKNVKGKRRLYMTATPRIYADVAEAKAEKEGTVLYSMNNEAYYGKELHVLTFSEAVMRGLLVDYKVIVLAMDEGHVSARVQRALKDENNQLRVDDAAKIIGCWKALSKQHQDDPTDDRDPMRRAVAFCQVIEQQKGAKVHKVSSKNIAAMFQTVVEEYQEQEEDHNTLKCEAEHIDGGMNASEKEKKLQWLKDNAPEDTCRILSNVRCLSEGVDVPALDAVLFLTPRNSQVDVVQSVGRIMRNAPGKKRGYVILPVVIPNDKTPEEALNDNKTYKVVWEVLQALRSHDDRFDAMINKFDLVGKDHSKMEVIAVTDKVHKKQKSEKKNTGRGSSVIGAPVAAPPKPEQLNIQFQIGEIERALYAKMVQKCGNRRHWEEWAKDIARIAQTHIARIKAIVNDPKNRAEVEAFTDFVEELRDDLNNQITDDEVIEMLAQHLITKPVFDALFDKYSFASKNPVSLAMQNVLDILQQHKISQKEADTLEKFYGSVKLRAEKIDDAGAKQKIVVELYDKFFRNAFPKMTEKLGIVYTPVEVVDFIIHSVNDVLQQEFGETLGSKGVHILDPFTGTGTFITRLLQSGLIDPKDLPHKYEKEIHANEIVLLAYYIAAINIEAAYHGLAGGDYKPFQGILLTDTFRLDEEDLVSRMLADNSERRKRQQKLDIRVIVGNPPYSVGQESANDENANIEYPRLDEKIQNTYGVNSKATLQRNLFDSYIRAIRWASDRVGNKGVVGYVTNASFIDAGAMDGVRKCLHEEYSSLYIFHLRGDQRTKGEISRKEGGKIFGGGSRAPIAISIFVKNPDAKEHGKIYFYDIGDYLTREQKLEIIADYKSVNGLNEKVVWQRIIPDKHNDWLRQRDESFDEYISLGDKKKKETITVFSSFSLGVASNRDAWCFNFSKKALAKNMSGLIDFYNQEVRRFKVAKDKNPSQKLDGFISTDAKKISWSRGLKEDLARFKTHTFAPNAIARSLYRPFQKQHLYFNRDLNETVGKIKDFGEDEYYVTKMKFAKKGDKSTVIYNDFITIRDIPLDAYDYVVNGKPALEWVMERQGVKEDKDSGIVNDANLYATETVGDPAYPLKLFQRIITVSLETMKIVRSLPKLDIQAPKKEKAA